MSIQYVMIAILCIASMMDQVGKDIVQYEMRRKTEAEGAAYTQCVD